MPVRTNSNLDLELLKKQAWTTAKITIHPWIPKSEEPARVINPRPYKQHKRTPHTTRRSAKSKSKNHWSTKHDQPPRMTQSRGNEKNKPRRRMAQRIQSNYHRALSQDISNSNYETSKLQSTAKSTNRPWKREFKSAKCYYHELTEIAYLAFDDATEATASLYQEFREMYSLSKPYRNTRFQCSSLLTACPSHWIYLVLGNLQTLQPTSIPRTCRTYVKQAYSKQVSSSCSASRRHTHARARISVRVRPLRSKPRNVAGEHLYESVKNHFTEPASRVKVDLGRMLRYRASYSEFTVYRTSY